MKRFLNFPRSVWQTVAHQGAIVLQKSSPLLAGTILLTSQNFWLFSRPAFADKTTTSPTNGLICALPGRDGSPTLSSQQVNTYYAASGSGSNAGATSITVGTGVGATGIQPGDLLLVIQMQGADIDPSNGDSYGDGDSTNNPSIGAAGYPAGGVVNGNLNNTNFTAGNFEYVVASNTVPTTGGTINFTSALVNSYSNSNATTTQGQRRYQVVRVPQYADLTISGTIQAAPWNGTTGGIVAIDVAGKTTFSGGQINVDGQGFRGGGGRQLNGDSTNTLLKTDVVSLSTLNANGSKGEGTAGTPKFVFNIATNNVVQTIGGNSVLAEGYPSGSFGRGAPGNAGGGGTDGFPRVGTNNSTLKDYGNGHNAGGGGGSNAGLGGKGGRTWESALPFGGDGGAIFPASAKRLVLGGGGGAGSNNNGSLGVGSSFGGGPASSGAPGGGIVFLRSGSFVGSGTINANGVKPPGIPGNDASGGGGAGGSILVIAQNGSTSGLMLNAKGGDGGTNTGGGTSMTSNSTPHGPGGGGGGGAVLASPGYTSAVVSGGNPGTTNFNSTNYGGATAGDGAVGVVPTTPADATTSISGAACALKVQKSTSTPGPISAPGTATYTIVATNPGGSLGATATNVTISDAEMPLGFSYTPTAITPVYAGGATGPATVTSSGSGPTSTPSWSGFTIPSGGSVMLTFTVNIAGGTTSGTYHNSAIAESTFTNIPANSTTPTTTAVKTIYEGQLSNNTGEDVTIADAAASPLIVNKTAAIVVDSDVSGGSTPLANQTATPGDILEYTLSINNPSSTPINQIVLSDALPMNTTYVPNSLQISAGANTGIKTDVKNDDQAELSGSNVVFRLGTGATAAIGGSLAASESTIVKFRVKINDPMPLGTSSVSNQALVAAQGYSNVISNDPATSAPNDPTVTPIGPRLRLVKRITGIKKDGSNIVTPITSYNDLATDINDDATVAWTSGAANYLQGAITASQVPTPNPGVPGPKDEVEYTIYFLSDGATNANSVTLCDFVPDKQTFVNGSIALTFNGNVQPLADGPGNGPGSGFYTSAFPAACTATNNQRGAVYVQVGSMTLPTAPPQTYHGSFKFRAKVD